MPVSTIDKYANLVEKVYEKTVDGAISWTEESAGTFSSKIGAYNIYIYKGGEFDSDVIFSLSNEENTIVDKFSDVDLADAIPQNTTFSAYYSLMLDLYKMADRDATGAEKVLDGVLSELGIEKTDVSVRKVRKKKPSNRLSFDNEPDDEIPF
jgi:hypothetical protein